MSQITTHVLDTSEGKPADGIKLSRNIKVPLFIIFLKFISLSFLIVALVHEDLNFL